MRGAIETEASKLMKRAATKLLDLMLVSKVESWRLSRREGYSSDCPAGERSIQAGMALDDVATAIAIHLSSKPLFIGRVEVRPYMTDKFVRTIVEKLNSDLEALEFRDYPGGIEGARKDEIRGRIVVLHGQGERASVVDVRDALKRAAAIDWSKEPSVVRRMRELEGRAQRG